MHKKINCEKQISVIFVYNLHSRRGCIAHKLDASSVLSYEPFGTEVTDLRKLENSILHPFQLLFFFFNFSAKTFLNRTGL